MGRRILYIILGSLLILALILGLWFWFFSKTSHGTPAQNLFGSGGDRNATSTTGSSGNNQAPYGSTVGGNVDTSPGGENTQAPIITGGDTTVTPPPYTGVVDNDVNLTPDIIWNDTYYGPSQSVFFDPTLINDFNLDDIQGTPHITTVPGADGNDISLLSGLGVVIGGCILNYGINWTASQPTSFVRSLVGGGALKVQVNDQSVSASQDTETITQCLVRTLGRLAIQAITESIVEWINSGFQGKPSFVQNFNQFFAGVADQAAGEFLQGSNFAFLCSPFQMQVKMAVAQSYARRYNSPSCTLSGAENNIQGFLNGDFAQGGWGNLISLTTQPNNNPFGAYMALNGGLQNAVGNAQANANLEINLGNGFLSYKQCDTALASGQPITSGGSNCKIVTPGSAIESSLSAAINQNLDSLQIGESIDEILAALQNALITKLLYGGLSNYGNSDTTSNTDTAAEKEANDLLDELRAAVTAAQQYATIVQRIIGDIQTTQNNLTTLENCWLLASSSPTLNSSQLASAQAGATTAAVRINQLESAITVYNQNINKANNSIVSTQELQTDVLMATVADDIHSVKTTWTTMKSSDTPHVYGQNDVISAQQDRTSAQANLATINTDTNAQLQQCHALQ